MLTVDYFNFDMILAQLIIILKSCRYISFYGNVRLPVLIFCNELTHCFLCMTYTRTRTIGAPRPFASIRRYGRRKERQMEKKGGAQVSWYIRPLSVSPGLICVRHPDRNTCTRHNEARKSHLHDKTHAL